MPEILVLYYSRGGSVANLARHVARGVGEIAGMSARSGHVAINEDESVYARSAEQAAAMALMTALARCGGLEIDVAEYTRLYAFYWSEFHASKT